MKHQARLDLHAKAAGGRVDNSVGHDVQNADWRPWIAELRRAQGCPRARSHLTSVTIVRRSHICHYELGRCRSS